MLLESYAMASEDKGTAREPGVKSRCKVGRRVCDQNCDEAGRRRLTDFAAVAWTIT